MADLIEVNHNSIQTWRSMYLAGGITQLLSHKKTGYKPSLITAKEPDAIDRKLKDLQNGLQGYTELLNWVEQEFLKSINYSTLYKYGVHKLGLSVNVARKSQINKDPDAIEVF